MSLARLLFSAVKATDRLFWWVLQGHQDIYPHARMEGLLDGLVGADCETLLDVGCGSDSPAKRVTKRLKHSTGIDGHAPYIDESRAKGIHAKYIQMDIRELSQIFKPNAYDVVVCADVIEHIPKEEGFRLLLDLERVASKRVIVTTPQGFVPQCGRDYDGNVLQDHVSGWRIWDFEDRGYRVIGFNGLRCLKGMYGIPKWRPRFLWWRIGVLTEMFLAGAPKHSFHLVAVKELP